MLREASLFQEHSSARGGAVLFGGLLRSAALWITALTIATVPWFLGGAIPHARCLLQAGAIIGAVLALMSCVLRRSVPVPVPLTAFPLLGLCLTGLLQLMPIYKHPALEMHHAAQSELAADLPIFQERLAVQKLYPRTVLPAETRQGLAQLLALLLIAMVVSETAVTSRDVDVVMGILVLSGCGMTALALSQQYGVVDAVVGNHWKVSTTTPFGCFVNPNNAAGWLIVCLSAAFYLAGRRFRSNHHGGIFASRRWATLGDRLWVAWTGFVGRVAEMTSQQMLVSSAIVLLMAGIAATLSRAGTVAAVLGIIAFGMSRLLVGRWLAAFGSLVTVLVLSCLFLSLMDLDTIVVSELRTLKDPVSDSTGRLLHWTDSLQSFLDFPLLGSGLSAYRCASMPYQRHDTGKWFQRADNQYVEVLVECGLAGLICFLAAGVMGAVFAFKALASCRRRSGPNSDVVQWLSSSAILSLVGMAGAAFFDYGISLTSVTSALVAIMAMLERWAVQSQKRSFEENAEVEAKSSLGGVFTALVWVLVIVACVAFLPDSIAAARVYEASAPAERLVSTPNVLTLIESGDRLLEELEESLAVRPDDILGQRVKVLLLELLNRRDLLVKLTEGQEFSPEQITAMFGQLNTASLAFRAMDPTVSDDLRQQVRSELKAGLIRYPWRDACQALLERTVGVPSIGLTQIESDIFFADSQRNSAAISYLRFSEPHGAAGLFVVGQLLLRSGRTDEARKCWDQSLAASEVMRPKMIVEMASISGPEAAFEWLLPETYDSCVKSAVECRAHPLLRQALLDRADQLWEERSPKMTEAVVLVRATHLTESGRVADALNALDEYLFSSPYSFEVRKAKAATFELAGRNADAYDEWLRIRSLHGGDLQVEAALKRLVRLPPTSDR